eukprot:GHVN01053691.1.p1 GENE.GHVN01053691.1~~GHVN01053691.1.p1  ORF type:complete len:130 (-),score=13.71 GHVN01053691.1:214-603(-)
MPLISSSLPETGRVALPGRGSSTESLLKILSPSSKRLIPLKPLNDFLVNLLHSIRGSVYYNHLNMAPKLGVVGRSSQLTTTPLLDPCHAEVFSQLLPYPFNRPPRSVTSSQTAFYCVPHWIGNIELQPG